MTADSVDLIHATSVKTARRQWSLSLVVSRIYEPALGETDMPMNINIILGVEQLVHLDVHCAIKWLGHPYLT